MLRRLITIQMLSNTPSRFRTLWAAAGDGTDADDPTFWGAPQSHGSLVKRTIAPSTFHEPSELGAAVWVLAESAVGANPRPSFTFLPDTTCRLAVAAKAGDPDNIWDYKAVHDDVCSVAGVPVVEPAGQTAGDPEDAWRATLQRC